MFSFHKPKIYRSLNGCCICRAKSSSSRFTDSKRYETDFEKCFKILEHRAGEICNACVLLVKRWKKLPNGSNRNWHHVVDARAGPGTKSMYKIKNRCKEERQEPAAILKKKHKHKHKHRKLHKAAAAPAPSPSPLLRAPHSPGALSDDIMFGDEGFSDNYNSRTPSPNHSDVSDDEGDEVARVRAARVQPAPARVHTAGRRTSRKPSRPARFSSFLDLTYWKKTEICCGTIFKGANGEVMVDTSLLRPCRACRPATPRDTPTPTPQPPTSCTRRQNSESCASSDSGVMTPREDSCQDPEDAGVEEGEGVEEDLGSLVEEEDEEDDLDDDMDDDLDEDEDGDGRGTPSPPTLHPEPAYLPYLSLREAGQQSASQRHLETEDEDSLPSSFLAGPPSPFALCSSAVAAAASAVLDLSRSARNHSHSHSHKASTGPPDQQLCIPMEV